MKVEISSANVQSLQLATKVDKESGDLIAKVSVETKLHPADIARILNLQKNKAPLFFSVGSQQAELDLDFFTIRSEKIAAPAAATDKAPATPESELVQCPKCHGKGSKMDETEHIDVACPQCQGVGKVTKSSLLEQLHEATITMSVSELNPSGDDGKTPKRRGRKAKQSPATEPASA